MPPTLGAVKGTGGCDTKIVGKSSMGAGSSMDSTASMELANSLLTKIFTQTDMLAYLTMTDPKACANFDFASANPAVQQDLRAAGGVRVLSGQSDRTAICFEQAKGYSKCFELYAALYPLLADGSVKRSGIVMKGGRRTRRQRGGKIETRGKGYDNMKGTPFEALNKITPFDVKYEEVQHQYIISLAITPVQNKIVFSIPESLIGSDSIRVKGSVSRSLSPSAESVECDIEIKKTETGVRVQLYEFSINTVRFLVLQTDSTEWFYSEVNEPNVSEPTPLKARGETKLSTALINRIKETIGFTAQASGTGSTYGTGSTSGASTSTSVSGAFFPPTVGEVKKNLQNYKEAKKNKPIALAIARALMLLRPLDPANSTGRAPTTQICAKTFTFEGKDSHVPRKGVALDKTYYFKSWMNLYADTGEMRAGKYEWVKGAEGMQELTLAAEDLSILYSQTTRDPKFLSKPLPEFIKLCPKFEGEYYIDPKVMPQIQKVIQQLMSVQKTHVGYANDILKQVFDFKSDGSVAFRKEILGREGYARLSELCKQTRHMLFQYYMSVESLFIQGVMIYEQALATNLLRPV